MSATIRASPGSPAVGWAGGRTVTVDRSPSAGGMGLGFNGGELLFLALAACATNDLHREAARASITLRDVRVDVDGEFPAEGQGARDVRYSVRVEGDASASELRALVERTDRVLEIHATLRAGAAIKLAQVDAVDARGV